MPDKRIIIQFMLTITKTEARRFLLNYHGLSNPRTLETDDEILKFIRKAGCIQYDPLNKAGRNADLVLQSRCRNYGEERLDNLLYRDRRLIDGWDKNMSVYPVEDWPYFHRKREIYNRRYGSADDAFAAVRGDVLDYLSGNESISSGDIKDKRIVDWSWAPTGIVRAVLEMMYHKGELVIHHKKGTRKYYAQAGKMLAPEIYNKTDPNLSDAEYNCWYVLRRIGSVGMLWNKSGDAWLGSDLKKNDRDAAVAALLKTERIVKVKIDDIEEYFYVRSGDIGSLNKSGPAAEISLIAPLDNLIWDRNMIRAIFDFDYKWEVYTPAKLRRYGYYVLPVICGDGFAGRIEPVYEKKTKTLHIRNWWPEKTFSFNSESKEAMRGCLNDFAGFLGAENIFTVNDELRKIIDA